MSESISYGVFVDERDGTQYKNVKIGTQVWMAENLKYAAEGSVCYKKNDSSAGGYSLYDPNAFLVATYAGRYGRLYDWETALAACPKGWHLPTDDEWQTLVDYACGKKTAGARLKSEMGWESCKGVTDDYGFSALPGGYRNSSGDFSNAGMSGHWWSATESNASEAWYRYMFYNKESVDRLDDSKTLMFSVRCVQD